MGFKTMVTNLKRLFKKDAVNQPISPFKQVNCLNTLSPENLADLLSFSEQRQFSDLYPDLTGKRVLFFSRPSTKAILENFPADQVSLLADYRIGNVPLGKPPGGKATTVNSPLSNRPNVYSLRGSLKPLPFRPQSFDLLLLPFASGFNSDLPDHLPSLAGLINNGGRAVISVVHPVFDIFLKNQNPASTARSNSNLQTWFTAFRDNDLYLETLSEGVVTRENKTFFPRESVEPTQPRQGAPLGPVTDDILGIPLVLFLRVVKYIKS